MFKLLRYYPRVKRDVLFFNFLIFFSNYSQMPESAALYNQPAVSQTSCLAT